MKVCISHKNASGFTLLEVIIAMTILSLILVLLFSTIFTANKTWKSTERKISQNDEFRIVGHFLQRQITQNVPLMWIDKGEQRILFEGKANELNFASALPAHRGGGGIQFLTLKTSQVDDVMHLSLYYQHANPDISPFEKTDNDIEQVSLLENVEGIKLSYFGREKVDEEASWRDEWQNKELLPMLISLKIYGENEQQNWPEIKIPVYSNFVKGQPQFILRKTNKSAI